MKKESKVFTQDEFNKRVEFWYNLMVKPDFPQKGDCPPITHDLRMQKIRNLGSCSYSPKIGFSFSYRMLDGRFPLEQVDDVIKHEIGHLYCFYKYGARQGHNSRFKELANRFNFGGNTTARMTIVDEFKEKVIEEKMSRYKYRIYCTICESEWFKDRQSGVTKNPSNYRCSCKAKGSLKVEKINQGGFKNESQSRIVG